MGISRRDFVATSATFGLGLSLSPMDILKAKKDYRSITILHTNDTHSRIDPFPENHKYHALKGGVLNRSKHIDAVRASEKEVLLLDAGDVFQGTPYFNKYYGHLKMKLMQVMRYDAMTMGNHDFDIGTAGFLDAFTKNASFDVIVSNYDCSNSDLGTVVKPHRIFEKGELKIGVFGLGIELKGLVPDSNFSGIQYMDPIITAKQQVKILKNDHKCDLVICLSHLGYSYKDSKVSDLIIAQEVPGIDLIIGGHTHTFLSKPTLVHSSLNHTSLVNQVGFGGINLGRIDFLISDRKVSSSKRLIEVK